MTSFLSKTSTQLWVVDRQHMQRRSDYLATEEPLEIRLTEPAQTLAITMRTPGADFELTAGFLLSEQVIAHRNDVLRMTHCRDRTVPADQRDNIVTVTLRPGLTPNLTALERHFYTTSACGVCGKTSLDALKIHCGAIAETTATVTATTLQQLPQKLQLAQGIFQATGGLHAAALFDLAGNLLAVQEDVGRHNALDKLLGSALLSGQLPLDRHIVLVSGRASFELLQKCLVARVPIVCAVSAPSSLAVAVAQEFNMTLIGFLRGERFNLYSGRDRVIV